MRLVTISIPVSALIAAACRNRLRRTGRMEYVVPDWYAKYAAAGCIMDGQEN